MNVVQQNVNKSFNGFGRVTLCNVAVDYSSKYRLFVDYITQHHTIEKP